MAWRKLNSLIILLFIYSLSTEAKTLTLSEFASEYVQKSYQIQAATEEQNRDEQRFSEAKSLAFPSIDLGVNKVKQKVPAYMSLFSPTELYQAELKLVQPIYLGGRIWKGISLKRSAKDISALKKIETQRLALLNAMKLAVDYSLMSEQVTAIEQSLQTQKSFVALTQRKLKSGNAKQYEYFQSQANLKAYETRLEELLVGKKNMANTIAEWLQVKASDAVTITLPKQPSSTVSLDHAIKQSLVSRPDLKIASKQLQVANLQKSLDMGEHLPSLNLIAAYGYNSKESDTWFDESSQQDSLTIALTVPLFSGLSSFNARKANASNISAAEKRLMQKQQDVRVEVMKGYQSFQSAQKTYSLSKQWRDMAEKALSSGLSSFKKGVIQNAQLVQLQQSREQAVLSYIGAQSNYYKTYLDFAASQGKDLKSFK